MCISTSPYPKMLMGDLEGKVQSHRMHDTEAQAPRAVSLEAHQIWSQCVSVQVFTWRYLWVTLRSMVKGRIKENRCLCNVSRQRLVLIHIFTNLYLGIGDIKIKGQGHGAQKIGFCEISP